MTAPGRLAVFLVMLSVARAAAHPRPLEAVDTPASAKPPVAPPADPSNQSSSGAAAALPAPLLVPPERLGVFVGAGYLGALGLHGAALSVGLRFSPVRYLALSFDLGYGVIGAQPTVQDRWWLMPAVAFVIPAGPVRIDVGAGLGLGAASGYATWSDYVAAPFTPVWAFQLVPAVRAHAMAALALRSKVDAFVRIDVASLLLGAGIGFRVGNDQPAARDTIWYDLAVGVHFWVL